MRSKKIYVTLIISTMLVSSVSSVVNAEEDIYSQVQQIYDDAYEQAQTEVDNAYEQAQMELNEAYEQAQKELQAQMGEVSDEESETGEENAPVTGKIKNYVGRNAASFGYYSLGGDRLDKGYGKSLDTLELILISDNGEYIDIENDDVLKQYVVIAQNIEPDSDITFTYDEYGMGESQTYSEIVLLCKRVDGDTENPVITSLTPMKPSPDRTTQYVKDYVGRNLASVGYTGLDGSWHDKYNATFNTVDIVVITDDGSYIDPDDKEAQMQYVVTSQNPEANSELLFNYGSYGFVESQTYEEIELYVSKVK